MLNENKSKRLVAFVGPSGSGKDTLMVKVRDLLLSSGIDIHIVQRMITRKPDSTEGFLTLSADDFIKKIENKHFVLHWDIYGNKYGIPHEEIDPYLESGYIVLVNLSRTALTKLKQIYPKAKIVVIHVSKELAAERIKIRKRDTGKNLEARISRLQEKVDVPFPDLIIKNEGEINLSLQVLEEFLRVLSY